ncbi:hypothetical protein SGRI78S_00401 [Streptomyces griseus subsp. griseus]
MDFAFDARTEELRSRLLAFMDEHVYLDDRVVVVDEVTGVGRADHVEVEISGELGAVGGRQVVDVVLRADQAQLLRAPPGEPQVLVGLVPGAGDGERGLQHGGRAGAVVVDPGAGGDRVEVGPGHQDLVGVAAGPVGYQVVAGGPARGELLERGGVSGRVELGLHVVDGRLVAGAAVGAVAAVVRGDRRELREVGLDVGQGDVGRGRGGCRRGRGAGGLGGRGTGREDGGEGHGGDGRRGSAQGEAVRSHSRAPDSVGD